MMYKGDTVTIYEDPITMTKPEGTAKLLAQLEDHKTYEVWMVKFLSDGYSCPRRIEKPI